jgi:signal transduction histidine kinase
MNGRLDYNAGMKGNTDAARLLRIAAILWVAYLGVSATIDYTLRPTGPLLTYLYVADSSIALLFLGITFWPWVLNRLGRAFLPFMIVFACAFPTIANQIAIRYLFAGPLPTPEAMLSRTGPFLLSGLLLVAWQYRLRQVLMFSLAIALVNVAILWAFVPDNKDAFSAGLFAIMTQVVGFLVVGFFISVMVGWLRNQRRALEEANLKLSNYARTLEDLAASRERNRIAQELHDTLSHTLSGLSVQLETMKAYWDVDPATARRRLDKSLTAARSGLEETRRVLTALRARPLEDLGLAPAIKQMAEDAASRAGIALDLAISDPVPVLSPDTEQCVFRVAQEAITNVLKHSSARTLTVSLGLEENKVRLTVHDDGVGFDVNAIDGNGHFGLRGMKERVESIKGKLSITSQPENGTTVQLNVE